MLRKPLVVINGQTTELPAGDSILPAGNSIGQIEQIVILVSGLDTTYEAVVSRIGTNAAASINCWLGNTEENELWQLEQVFVSAFCEVDQITFYVSSQTIESGSIKINYQVTNG